MASNRISRINEELQRELSALIRSLKDPRVQQSMVSVTKVEATGDLRYAKVYISAGGSSRDSSPPAASCAGRSPRGSSCVTPPSWSSWRTIPSPTA